MLDVWHDGALGGGVGSQLVGYDALWMASLLSQQPRQQAFRSFRVAAGLDDFVENVTLLIDGAPQPTPLAVDRDDDLVQVPDIAATWRFAPQATRVIFPEFDCPASDGLVGDDDTAFPQHFFDQAEAQGKSEIQPHCMGDDLRRETVTFVTHGSEGHAGPPSTQTLMPS